jgi:hypothetical protein
MPLDEQVKSHLLLAAAMLGRDHEERMRDALSRKVAVSPTGKSELELRRFWQNMSYDAPVLRAQMVRAQRVVLELMPRIPGLTEWLNEGWGNSLPLIEALANWPMAGQGLRHLPWVRRAS